MLADDSIRTLQAKIKAKELSVDDVVLECQQQITKVNPLVNAIITPVTPAAERKGDLTGIPYVLKDCYSTKDVRTTCSSKVLDNYIPPYNATIVDKLDASGAILLGKANMDAWGHGGSTENTDYGVTKNPWDISRVAGGSSGGPAVAIATRMCLFAIGEDTGGSIRNPAGWCNITGLKVTYGRVSRYGTIAYASSFDSVGPMAKTAQDCAMVLNIIAGNDPLDATSSDQKVPDYTANLDRPISGLKIGLPKEFFTSGLDSEQKTIIMAAVDKFTKLGVEIIDISLPMLEYAVSTYYLLAPSETSSNLGRYDGFRFGSNRQNFTNETIRRIMIGTYALSAGYVDAYYRKAQQARTLIINDFTNAFTKCDVIISPISPTAPTKIGDLINDPVRNLLADIYNVTTNPAGIPSLALPCGFSADGLPVGLQIQGPMFSESLLLNIGHQYQQATDWHLRKPPVI